MTEIGSTMPIPGGPRWTLVGVDLTEEWAPKAWGQGWRVMVIASSDLTKGELEAKARTWTERNPLDPGDLFGVRRHGEPIYRLTAEMRRFVLCYGSDYGDAIRKIMGTWNPDEPQAQLEADHWASPAEEAEFRQLGPGQL